MHAKSYHFNYTMRLFFFKYMIWGSHQDSTILSIIWPELGLYYLTYLTSGGHQNSTIISIIWPGAAIRTLQSYPSSDLRQPSGLYSPTHDLMFWWSSCVYYLLPSYFLIYPRTSFSVFLYLSSQVFSHIRPIPLFHLFCCYAPNI